MFKYRMLRIRLGRERDRLHVERQTAYLIGQDGERRRGTGVTDGLALDDGIEGGRATLDIVGLDIEHLPERVGRAIAQQGPHFHLAEALAAVLRLAAERLLGNERVGADATHVNLVF